MLPRKASKERNGYPYRKPTQVGEKNILRRECDPSFRNSANWPRNFGIRGARLTCTVLAIAIKRPKRLFTKNTGLCEVEHDV
jgi:hypothetical protein